jgi:hypothetical protein
LPTFLCAPTDVDDMEWEYTRKIKSWERRVSVYSFWGFLFILYPPMWPMQGFTGTMVTAISTWS